MTTLTEVANKLIEQTNCSTDQAIHALEQADGNYEKALKILIAIDEITGKEQSSKDESNKSTKEEEYTLNGKEILKLIKQLIQEGNVSKITIKRKNEVILNIPVNAVAIGAVLAPFISVLAGITAVATDCTIQVQRKGNVVVDVSDKLQKAGSKVEEVINDIIDR